MPGSSSNLSDPQPTRDSGTSEQARQLVLVKHGQRFVFRYVPGQESAVLAELARLVADPASGLSWFDAAMLSHQMGHAIGQQLESLRQS